MIRELRMMMFYMRRSASIKECDNRHNPFTATYVRHQKLSDIFAKQVLRQTRKSDVAEREI